MKVLSSITFFSRIFFVGSEEEDIGIFFGKECRAAIWALGQCYLVDGETIIKNVYYEELTKS